MKVWQVREPFGSSDIILISCFTTACLGIIKVENKKKIKVAFLPLEYKISNRWGRQNSCEKCCPVSSTSPI